MMTHCAQRLGSLTPFESQNPSQPPCFKQDYESNLFLQHLPPVNQRRDNLRIP
uniref:Uncharacterized protein n=1 Tax=Anguilla anguilla TaxID=7936 RepID=A0A0E9T8Y3_ANGAN